MKLTDRKYAILAFSALAALTLATAACARPGPGFHGGPPPFGHGPGGPGFRPPPPPPRRDWRPAPPPFRPGPGGPGFRPAPPSGTASPSSRLAPRAAASAPSRLAPRAASAALA